MSVNVSVLTDGDRPVVVKHGGASSAARLRAEGERLRRASHPGVVEVLRSAPADGGWELRMAHGGRPVEALGELSVPQAAALVAGLASTVADLHDLGVVHGRIDGSHVLVGDHGRPLLCGFGDGVADGSPEDDVAGIGLLLSELVGAGTDVEPIPDHRWRRRRPWTGWDRRGLLLLADQACAEPPTRRPTARRLAAAVAAAVPAARTEGPAHASVAHERTDIDPMASLRATALVGPSEGRPRPATLVVGLVGLGLVVVGVGRLPGSSPAEPNRVSGPRVPESAASAPLADEEVTLDGVRYQIGEAGDELLIDDWDCDGTPTPALLRPTTGEVFVFPRWIDHGRLEVAAILQVDDAVRLLGATSASGCPTLEVRTSGGDRVPVIESPR